MCGVTRFQLKKPEDLSGEVTVQRQSLRAEHQLPEARRAWVSVGSFEKKVSRSGVDLV